MSDGDDRARILLEESLEPGHRFGVEMVGGFIEQQEIGALEEQSAQSDPTPFAA